MTSSLPITAHLGARDVARRVVDEDDEVVLREAVARAQEGSGLGAGGEQLPARSLRLRRGAGPRQEGAERRPQRRPGLRGQTSCKISNELFVCFIGKSDNPSKTINILKMLFSMEPSSG